MKKYWKFLLKWAVCFIACFAVIWLIVFIGGWKLFESGDVVLIELGFALILSVFLLAIAETITVLNKRIDKLEEKIEELEKHTH